MKENKIKLLITLLIVLSIIMILNTVFAADEKENTDLTPTVSYRTHVQDVGWQNYVQNGDVAGTSGQSKRLEGINIKLLDVGSNINIKYQVHVQNIGWQDWKKDGAVAGSSGKRIEAIRIKLENTDEYSVKYRAHVQNVGWQDWKADGVVGTDTMYGSKIPAIQVSSMKIKEKGTTFVSN